MNTINRIIAWVFAPVQHYMAAYTARSWEATKMSDGEYNFRHAAAERKLAQHR